MSSKVVRISRAGSGHAPTDLLYTFGRFQMDPVACVLWKDSEQVPVAPKVFETLLILIVNRDRVLPKEELLKAIWPDTVVEESNLTQNIFLLRKALGQTAGDRFILTVPGKGYRFVAEVATLERPAAAVVSPQSGVRKPGRTVRGLIVGGLILVAALLFFGYTYLRPDVSGKSTESHYLTSLPGREVQPAISPDSKRVAFSWNGEKEDNFDIYVKEVGAEAPLRLTNDIAEDGSPAWSPDGNRIAFLRLSPQGSGIFVVPASGGAESKLAPVYTSRYGVEGRHLDWSPDGKTLAVDDKGSDADALSLFLLDIASGHRRRLTEPPARSTSDIAPRFSPDGKQVAFVRCTARIVRDVYVIPVSGGKARRVTFDNRWVGDLDWTPDGREIIFSSERGGMPSLWRVKVPSRAADKPLEPRPVTPTAENALYVGVGRKSNRLVYSQTVVDVNIWRLDLPEDAWGSGSWTRLIASTRDDSNPEYSPDGKHVAFRSDRSGVRSIWISDLEGRDAKPLSPVPGAVASASWSPDGQYLAFDSHNNRSYDIYISPVGGGSARQLTYEDSEDVLPRWSADGRFVYFSSNRSGEWQIWRVPAVGGKAEQITVRGGFAARPSPNGDLVYYSKGMTFPGIWSVPISGGQETRVLEAPKAECWPIWTVTSKGIWFMDGQAPGVLPPPEIKFFDFATQRLTTVARANKPLYLIGVYNLSVSPDGRSVLTAQLDQASSDLVTVDGYK